MSIKSTLPIEVIDDLISSFEYIEKTRAYGVNKAGKGRKIPLSRCADLYYAGAKIVSLVENNGTEKQQAKLKCIIEDNAHFFI